MHLPQKLRPGTTDYESRAEGTFEMVGKERNRIRDESFTSCSFLRTVVVSLEGKGRVAPHQELVMQMTLDEGEIDAIARTSRRQVRTSGSTPSGRGLAFSVLAAGTA